MMVTLFGLFLVIPNAVTLLIFVLIVVLINIQVRLEEEYLKSSHGEDYVRYQRTVARWI
jgi:protein-S-isoprenylcysteine O-methyltransferase Ste14